MNIRPIHNSKDHEQALARLTALLESDPAPDSDAGAELEVIATLIEKFEAESFPIAPPTPLEAIRFRMDQQGLKNKDLVPYIGSASKVSEVLNGKRPLSLTMIRNLHRHLGIPAEVLIQDDSGATNGSELDAKQFPAKDMHQRGYFSTAGANWVDVKERVPELLSRFLHQAGIHNSSPAFCRSTAHYRQGKTLNETALLAWQARVLIRSKERKLGTWQAGTVDEAFLEKVADLSVFDEGPRLARELLEKHGIAVVIEPHLQKTYLDGAAFLRGDSVPVIGLTLRHDKVDNFWFTLLHELVHVGWHINDDRTAIFDDVTETAGDEIERAADDRAGEALIPASVWRKAKLRIDPTPEAAIALARKLNRHPAIVVGRLQRDEDDYRLLVKSPGIGRSEVRKQFEEFQKKAWQ